MLDFKSGYESTLKNIGGFSGAATGASYVATIEAEIEKLNIDMNSFMGYRTNVSKLKGDIAEFWHSGTHNIDAAVKDVQVRTFVDRSKGLGSADITSTWEEPFGLKYYKDSVSSAQQQAKTYFERYKEYVAQSSKEISFDDWLNQNNITGVDPNAPLYLLQTRIIPKDQLKDAITWLEKKIPKETEIRHEQVARYKDTLDMLKDKIKSPDGSESIALTKEEAELIAGLAKKGEFDSIRFELTTEQLIQYQYVLNQALKAGVSAATISVILKIAPEIYKAIDGLIEQGEIDKKCFARIGFAAVSGGAEGFIRGSVAATITATCKAGLLGATFKTVDTTMVGAVTVIMMNAVQNSFKMATGKMNKSEFADACARDLFITTFSMTLGGITQGFIEIPVLGFMLGSFVGAVMGGMAYNTAQGVVLSFCVESGFTFFGLVEQDYELPTEILEKIGFAILDYKEVTYKTVQHKQIEHKAITHKTVVYHTLDTTVLRRGVIGVNKVGYV